MGLDRKQSARTAGPVSLPEAPPRLPDDVKERFPSLAAWEAQWLQIWQSATSNLKSRDSDVESRLTKLEQE